MATEGGGDVARGGDELQERIFQREANPRVFPMIIVSPWQQDIDLTTKQGSSLWNEGTRPVEEKFTGQGRDVPRFIALVKNQVSKCYLSDVTTVNGKNLWWTTVRLPWRRSSVLEMHETQSHQQVYAKLSLGSKHRCFSTSSTEVSDLYHYERLAQDWTRFSRTARLS